jgi:hypothetical protein
MNLHGQVLAFVWRFGHEIAHKLKKNYAASSVLVAGAIGIFLLYVTCFFHEYQLFSRRLRFVIKVITFLVFLVSVSYNRQRISYIVFDWWIYRFRFMVNLQVKGIT